MPGDYFKTISFYIVAHADDWQLFMHPNVYNDIKAFDNKVVFIITTAGDAGMTKKYWLAREEGSKSSLRFCLGDSETSQSEEKKEFNGHTIQACAISNIIFYFLRLPDGNIEGNGFLSNNFQSLSKLKSGNINAITALDNSTTYNEWQDFVSTLEAIILFESSNIHKTYLHYINPDATINTNDHADHAATGQAIQCMNIVHGSTQLLFDGYNSINTANKLNNADALKKQECLQLITKLY